MWTWLRAHATPYYGMYWYERGLREYEFIFGKKPLAEVKEDSEVILPRLNQAIAKYIQETSTHWGQGKINPSTIAWLLYQVERDAIKSDLL